MSWNISKAAKGSEIVSGVEASAVSYTEPKTQKIVAAIVSLLTEMADGHDEHFVTVDTNGHVDQYNGSATVTIRVWPK